MARTDPDFSTDRQRNSMLDWNAKFGPSTIADQLRNDGYERADMEQGSNGPSTVPCRYPLPGNAGFDTDHDSDDYNSAVYQQPSSTTSSSGPY